MDIISGSRSFHKLAGTYKAWYGLKVERCPYSKTGDSWQILLLLVMFQTAHIEKNS